jgi:carbon-monoxide dehydrogenase medium subunit
VALWQRYYQPQTIEEALAALARHEGRARVVSGGTDLLLEMQQGHKPPLEALVDVTCISDMKQIRQQESWIEVGAAVTHSDIVNSPLVTERATCLVESCGVIGGPQVRNVATLGGNVAHALPAADGTTALVALEAEAEVATMNGHAWQPILSLFQGPGLSAIDPAREVITRFRFAAPQAGEGTAFKRIMRPQGVALPVLACAVWVRSGKWEVRSGEWGVGSGELDRLMVERQVIEDARICIGPVRPAPCRAEQGEQALRGRSLAEALEECVAAAQAEFTPRTSKHRATAAYRRELMAVLLRRSLPLAMQRALTGQAIPEGVGLQ